MKPKYVDVGDYLTPQTVFYHNRLSENKLSKIVQNEPNFTLKYISIMYT